MTQCVIGSHKYISQMGSKSAESFKQAHDCDRQTDHALKKFVGIGGIACAARAILPKNTYLGRR